jgi:uncharacterized membrane protein
MRKRELVLILGGISFIALIISLSLLLGNHLEVKTCGCPKMISQNFIWLFTTLAIVFVVSLLYYLFSLKMEQKEKCLCKNMEILNSILDKDEKNVIDKLSSNNGEIEQSRISEMYDKIKAHRILKKLEGKRIIEIVKFGKTNTIKLNEELGKELRK